MPALLGEAHPPGGLFSEHRPAAEDVEEDDFKSLAVTLLDDSAQNGKLASSSFRLRPRFDFQNSSDP
jgi:hypothetical protein